MPSSLIFFTRARHCYAHVMLSLTRHAPFYYAMPRERSLREESCAAEVPYADAQRLWFIALAQVREAAE